MSQAKSSEILQDFGPRLRFFRTEKKLSQEKLGDLLGKAATTVSTWERGESEPSRSDIVRIAEILNVDPAKLAYGNSVALGVEEPPADYVKSREISGGESSDPQIRVPPMLLDPRHAPRRGPSTQGDCETYFTELMKRAKHSNNPDAFPAIMTRLKKSFPLDEWDEHEE